MIYDSIKQWFLRVIEEEQKQAAPTPVSVNPQPHAEVNGDCPICGTPKAIRQIYARALRCSQCGWQPNTVLAPGIPRSQLETFQYPDAAHRRKFRQSFNDALMRIVGPRR